MDARLEALRAQYESGEMSEAAFRQRLDALIPALPSQSTWWQRWQHQLAQRRLQRDQQTYESRRLIYQREQAEKATHNALLHTWQDAYQQLAQLLPDHDWRRLLPPPDPRLSTTIGVTGAAERQMHVNDLRSAVQEIIWDLERLDKIVPSQRPIATPEDALARLK